MAEQEFFLPVQTVTVKGEWLPLQKYPREPVPTLFTANGFFPPAWFINGPIRECCFIFLTTLSNVKGIPGPHLFEAVLVLRNQYGLHCCSLFPTLVR